MYSKYEIIGFLKLDFGRSLVDFVIKRMHKCFALISKLKGETIAAKNLFLLKPRY